MTSISALFAGFFGPVLGEYAAIVFASLAGALWPLSNRPSVEYVTDDARLVKRAESVWSAAFFVLRLVLMATVLTSLAATLIEYQWGFKASVVIAPIAFVIGVLGDNWRGLFETALAWVKGWITKRGGTQ